MDKKETTQNEEEFIVTKQEPEQSQVQAPMQDPDQEALFEVSKVSETSACDDNPQETKSIEVDMPEQAESEDKKKIEELTEQNAALNDKYLRLMAEFDNYKRRSAKDYERLIEAANERLIKDIIEVRENFERAFKSNDQGEKFVEGMKLNYAKLNAILQKHGLEVYAEPGHEFNPELHDALMRAPHETIPDSHITDVHERGYKLKGKIIKHAKVVVSSGKPEEKKEDHHKSKK
ncbi:MAG: nucleotide exchange factor GrpE [Chitinivibrionales bacterium]